MLKNVVVQLLPIVKNHAKGKGKVLLTKWTHGDFKDRYTGMIKFTDLKNNPLPSNEKLKEIAKSLLPEGIPQERIKTLDLVAILEFADPPACEEYVFLADMKEESNNDNLVFDKSPCYWFDWDQIPFKEMPEDDPLWYPDVLQGGKLMRGSFTFGDWKEKSLKSYWVKAVDKF